MWPTFVAVTLLDGLIMWRLPPVGGGVDLIPAILIATFANLVIIAVLAPGSRAGCGRAAPPRNRAHRRAPSSRC